MKKLHQHSSPHLLLMTFLSGFVFLLFEVSFNRMLSLVLGNTVFASTLVLAMFMAGLGLGGYYLGNHWENRVTGKKMLTRLYVLIAIAGVGGYVLFKSILPWMYSILGDASIVFKEVVVYSIAVVYLGGIAFLIGGVMPTISGMLIQSDKELGAGLGSIYGFETLGSMIGGLITGFILVGWLGQFQTILVGVFISIGLAVTAQVSFRNSYYEKTKPQPKAQSKNEKLDYKLIPLILMFISGFVILGLQILWMRAFRVFLTNTSYTFALIASLTIGGLFAGSFLYRTHHFKIKDLVKTATILLSAISILAFLGLFFILNMPEWIMAPLQQEFISHSTRLFFIPAISSMILILPITVVSGFAFPFAIYFYTKNYQNVSGNFGRIMLANSIGSLIGPLVAAFVLIPFIGVSNGIIVLALVGLVAALGINIKFAQDKIRKRINIIIGGLILVMAIRFVSVDEQRIMPPSFHVQDRDVLYYNETVQGTVVVGQEKQGNSTVKSTYVNNASVIGSSYDAIKAVKMVGHMPFFSGLKCKEVLIVGFGIGVTTSAIADHKEVRQIDCVELVPGLTNAASFYSDLNKNILNDPRLNIKAGDGRHYLQTTGKRYDLISSDPTHPVLGSGSLYTKEYFELYKEHLNPGGMVSQYLPMHKLTRDSFLGLIKTFQEVFPNSVVWLGHYHAVLMGSMGDIKIDFEQWEERIQQIPKDMYFYTNPYHLAANLVIVPGQSQTWNGEIQVNTDNHSYVEFFKPSCFEEENLPLNLSYLNDIRGDVFSIFKNIPDSKMMKRFVIGNKEMTSGLVYMLSGNQKGLYSQLQKAIRVNPENQEYPFLMKLYFR